MNEIEMLEEVQKELSKQYLKVAELQNENAKMKKLLKECKKCIEDCPIFGIGSEQKAKKRQELLNEIDGVLK